MHEPDVAPGAENYEHRDAQLKLILFTGIVLVVVTFIAYLVGFVIMNGFESRKTPTDYVASPILSEKAQIWAPGTRLQVEPWTEFDALKAKFDHETTTPEQLSEEPLVYRIPVSVAMDLVVENGLPEINAIPLPVDSSEAAPAATPDPPAH